jgi:hypothetical protein
MRLHVSDGRELRETVRLMKIPLITTVHLLAARPDSFAFARSMSS